MSPDSDLGATGMSEPGGRVDPADLPAPYSGPAPQDMLAELFIHDGWADGDEE